MRDIPEYISSIHIAVQQFYKETHAYLQKFVEPMNASGPPQLLYHYTKRPGLEGILNSGEL
jgi:hypothetical protein